MSFIQLVKKINVVPLKKIKTACLEVGTTLLPERYDTTQNDIWMNFSKSFYKG